MIVVVEKIGVVVVAVAVAVEIEEMKMIVGRMVAIGDVVVVGVEKDDV